MKTFTQHGGTIRVDVGPRGVGKTSLLRTAQKEADVLGFDTVWITAGDGTFLESLIDEFQRASQEWKKKARELVRHALSELSITLGPVSVKTPPPSTTADKRPSSSSGRKLQDVLTVSTKQSQQRGSCGLALFIDEIQSADAEGLRALAYAWQHLQSESPNLPIVAFTAGLSHTQDVVTDAVSFAERFRYSHLGNLDPVAASFAATAPAAAAGVAWEESALEEALNRAQGYPYFLQLCDFTWKAAGYPDPGARLETRHLHLALDDFLHSQNDFFRARWAKTTVREAQMLRAMAALGNTDIRRADIAAHLGTTTQSISMERRSLMDKGLIESTRYGFLSFTAPGFAAFIRSNEDLY